TRYKRRDKRCRTGQSLDIEWGLSKRFAINLRDLGGAGLNTNLFSDGKNAHHILGFKSSTIEKRRQVFQQIARVKYADMQHAIVGANVTADYKVNRTCDTAGHSDKRHQTFHPEHRLIVDLDGELYGRSTQ